MKFDVLTPKGVIKELIEYAEDVPLSWTRDPDDGLGVTAHNDSVQVVLTPVFDLNHLLTNVKIEVRRLVEGRTTHLLARFDFRHVDAEQRNRMVGCWLLASESALFKPLQIERRSVP